MDAATKRYRPVQLALTLALPTSGCGFNQLHVSRKKGTAAIGRNVVIVADRPVDYSNHSAHTLWYGRGDRALRTCYAQGNHRSGMVDSSRRAGGCCRCERTAGRVHVVRRPELVIAPSCQSRTANRCDPTGPAQPARTGSRRRGPPSLERPLGLANVTLESIPGRCLSNSKR